MTILHFERPELEARQGAACDAMASRGLDGLLLFRQESMYYLTGYDTAGYTMFQALYLRADGRCALLTRPIDLIQAQLTSIIEDIRIWRDGEDARPAVALRDLLKAYGGYGKTIGVEYHAYGLTGQRAKMVDAALEGFCTLKDASDLIRSLQLVKSAAELEYVRRAGALCDHLVELSIARCVPGASVKGIYGELIQALTMGGGDPPASRWPAGAGETALFGRYYTGDNTVGTQDQVFFEPGAAYRHYHACAMYNVVVGSANRAQRDMCKACGETLDACQDALRPGRTVGEVFDLHKRKLAEAGYGDATMSACGYTMGAMYPPTWMDWPMFWTGNPRVMEAGMVFFLHMILFDRDTGISMCLGETAIVTEGAPERVNHVPRELIHNDRGDRPA